MKLTASGVANWAAIDGDGIEVALIPHTLELTTLSELESGSLVNVEADVLAKYVEKLHPGTMAP